MDKYAELRAALDAGPKPGKWTWKQVGSFNTPGCAVFWPDASKGGTHFRRLDSGGGMEQVDADFIAAANPETIRALLAERDAMREALQSIVDCCDEDHAARDYASRQTEIRGIARYALAQEQGGSDG